MMLCSSAYRFAESINSVFPVSSPLERGLRPFSAYTLVSVDELELAYAVTIHKSQGSEYPAVVIPLLTGPRMLMNRNLLYTAVTRARSCVTLVGSKDTFRMMVENSSEQARYSGLADRISEVEQLEQME